MAAGGEELKRTVSSWLMSSISFRPLSSAECTAIACSRDRHPGHGANTEMQQRRGHCVVHFNFPDGNGTPQWYSTEQLAGMRTTPPLLRAQKSVPAG